MSDFPFPCTAPIHKWKEQSKDIGFDSWFCSECGVVVFVSPKKKKKTKTQTHRGAVDRIPVRQFVSNPDKIAQLQQRLEDQDGQCFYCRQPLELDLAVREHKIPRSRGGPGGRNIVAACVTCDHEKGNQLESEWTNRWYEQPNIMPREEYLTKRAQKKPNWNWENKKRDAT